MGLGTARFMGRRAVLVVGLVRLGSSVVRGRMGVRRGVGSAVMGGIIVVLGRSVGFGRGRGFVVL